MYFFKSPTCPTISFSIAERHYLYPHARSSYHDVYIVTCSSAWAETATLEHYAMVDNSRQGVILNG